MSAMKWTPAPWSVDDGDSEAYGIFAADNNPVAYLSENPITGTGLRPEDMHNARLIAAAPELFQSAIAAWHTIQSLLACRDGATDDLLREVADALQGACAKAGVGLEDK